MRNAKDVNKLTGRRFVAFGGKITQDMRINRVPVMARRHKKSVPGMIWNFVYIVFVIVCIFLIITVLLQPGKSGGLGAAFGGGGNTVFGASGGTPVFRRMTTGAAVCFMLLSLLLAWAAVDTSTDAKEKKQVKGLDFKAEKLDLLEIPAAQPSAAPLVAPSETPEAAAQPTPAAPTLPEPALNDNLLGNTPRIGLGSADFGVPALAMPSLDIPVDAPAADAPVDAPAADAPVDAPTADAPVDAPAADAPVVEAVSAPSHE